jgi:hypothetical protein
VGSAGQHMANSQPGGPFTSYCSLKGHPCANAPVLLATAVIRAKDNLGKERDCRVLLDSASQLDFVSKPIAQ